MNFGIVVDRDSVPEDSLPPSTSIGVSSVVRPSLLPVSSILLLTVSVTLSVVALCWDWFHI